MKQSRAALAERQCEIVLRPNRAIPSPVKPRKPLFSGLLAKKHLAVKASKQSPRDLNECTSGELDTQPTSQELAQGVSMGRHKTKGTPVPKRVVPEKKKPDLVQTTVRLPPALIKALDEVGEEEGYSRNEIFQFFLEFALAEHREHKKTLGD